MKISFVKKIPTNDHLVIIIDDGKSILNSKFLNEKTKKLIKKVISEKEISESSDFNKTFFYDLEKKIESITIVKTKIHEKLYKYEALTGNLLVNLEKNKIQNASILIEEGKKLNRLEIISAMARGIFFKNYRFEKYKTVSKKFFNVKKVNFCISMSKVDEKKVFSSIEHTKGVFLTRDLVSEPANILYPEKFVENCQILKKVGVIIEVFDEKKMKSLGMNALLGVGQGSTRPSRVMIMKWQGGGKKFGSPLAFVGKGVTFDTGGISIKPSSGMEDMKWDMGGAAVVAGLIYSLAIRKSKTNAIGIVGLVENMPDGSAQRPGDVVKSLSGQTIEVLNTDAEGRLVLADILWYMKEKFKPKFMIDLATLTGAIIVALGERYAGLFSNDDDLASKILGASQDTGELSWRLPMDNEFDKLLNCPIADMKNITGTRGAGSITAAQFLKRFVGNTKWAHLDIAGVAWSKKGTDFARSGGTGFGVRLLDQFVKNNYE